jgi:hypothetical protein
MNLFTKKMIDIEGKWGEIETTDINVWAAVNVDTGEVCTDEIYDYEDNLPKISSQWEWKKFSLVLVPPTQEKP